MAKEIVLKNITVSEGSIDYDISVAGKEFKLNYQFDVTRCIIDFDKIEERFDPIVISLLYQALVHGFDFRSEYPVSGDLLYQVTYQFVPQMLRCAPKGTLHSVKIDAPIQEVEEVENWIGLDFSCNIESLAALYDYSRFNDISDSRVTHLICFDIGFHPTKSIALAEIDNVKHFRDRTLRRLIVIHSNFADILKNAFGDSDYALSHTFGKCGAVTILQNYFRRCYCPAEHNLDEFKVDISRDCSYYERWFLPFISPERLHFWSADCRAATRFQKLQLISRYNFSYDTLYVCKQSANNCGHCDDCRWTLVAFDVLDVLKRYTSVFDIEDYKAHRAEYVDYIFEHRKENKYFATLYQLLPDAWKNDDSVFKLTTYHDTMLYLDDDCRLWHKKSDEITGDHYPLYVRLNGERAVLFFVKNKEIKYVHNIENGQKKDITETPAFVDIERISDDSIVIRRDNYFLTALPLSGNFKSREINVVWERYYLTEADFTYNDLSDMKNFVALDRSKEQ